MILVPWNILPLVNYTKFVNSFLQLSWCNDASIYQITMVCYLLCCLHCSCSLLSHESGKVSKHYNVSIVEQTCTTLLPANIHIFPLVSTNLASHLTLMMTSAQVVECQSLYITNNTLSPLRTTLTWTIRLHRHLLCMVITTQFSWPVSFNPWD